MTMRGVTQELAAVRGSLPWYVVGKYYRARRIVDGLVCSGAIKATTCDAYACYGGRVYGLGADFECEKCSGTGWLTATTGEVAS